MADSIHLRLKTYRHQRKLTAKQVSEMTGIPVSTYKEWENGRKISGEPYEVLAKVFEVSLQELITGNVPNQNHVLTKLNDICDLIEAVKKDLLSTL